MNWKGVIPAITTCFTEDLKVDHGFMANHCRWLVENGCAGVAALGSLGEGAVLSLEEKFAILRTCVSALRGRAVVIATVSALTTSEATAIAQHAAEIGCDALMVLPPYVYQGDWRETKRHITSVFSATSLPCILYNNPVAYGTDFLPEHIAELAEECPNLQAVKESSTDARRVSAIRALTGDRLHTLVGVDDAVLETVGLGASGWIAGLANALPRESVELFNLGRNHQTEKAFELYRWFLPLLRMDTVPHFVQLIKMVQAECGMGNTRVRPPRLPLVGEELESNLRTIRKALAARQEPMSTSSALVERT